MSEQEINRKYLANECIKNNYNQREKALVNQFYMEQRLHGPTIGSMREEIWKEFFEMILPKKFAIE